MRYLFPLKLEYMEKGRNILSLILFESFRDLTVQITYNSRDRSTLNEILSLIGQNCV